MMITMTTMIMAMKDPLCEDKEQDTKDRATASFDGFLQTIDMTPGTGTLQIEHSLFLLENAQKINVCISWGWGWRLELGG